MLLQSETLSLGACGVHDAHREFNLNHTPADCTVRNSSIQTRLNLRGIPYLFQLVGSLSSLELKLWPAVWHVASRPALAWPL